MPHAGETHAEVPALRRAGRAARRAIAGEARHVAQRKLVAHVTSLHVVRTAVSVGVFVADDGEPDLALLVAELWNRGVEVALPVLSDDPDDFSISFQPWREHDQLASARFGIPAPPSRPPIVPQVVLVPFVAFDAAGHRIGRGGGFFDRYLAADANGAATQAVGVGFEAQRVPAIPKQPHDVDLAVIVTDMGIRFCANADQIRSKHRVIGKDGASCESSL